MTAEEYESIWRKKTKRQIEKEIVSWHKYLQKHASYYEWHGTACTPPGELADGDKLLILRVILAEKEDVK